VSSPISRSTNQPMNESTLVADAETKGLRLGGWSAFYDLFTLSRFRAREVLRTFPPRPGERVLDVGCGTGGLALLLREAVGASGEVVATDAAAAMVESTRRKALRRSLDLDCRVAAVERLPFPDRSFDRAYATLTLHHLPPNVKRAGLAEVHRVLRSGGRFCVVDFGRCRLPWRALFSLPRLLGPFMAPYYYEALAPHLKGELPRYLEAAGFQVTVLRRSFGIVESVAATKATASGAVRPFRRNLTSV